ncbi:conserved hypothetical protein [Verticillium alfalfae VaMs.102]|uniref:Uncharacterized protein n=1 Tax=Verticillium alfalfae (strain VaMs.102 / ATCC MYA-4576 / FGSC 10136) TaxID=526221 RepID=C9SEX7_VERA1|nr:conserved hypothetical protein [Verticillium alfalfae VaMs.102]EEY17763.1 conserved hypothetical protein [Verticillium alfalfae VaMs.102]
MSNRDSDSSGQTSQSVSGGRNGNLKPLSSDRSRYTNRAPDINNLHGFRIERRDLKWDMPTDSLDDFFFEDQYLLMLQQIYALMETTLVLGPRRMPYEVSPWSLPTANQGDVTLEQYTSLVAQPDPLFKYPWDTLLIFKRETQHFLTAVMNKMLHEMTFKSLLFGASKEQMKILTEQDDTLINEEGFGRTRLRAEYINMFLKGRAPPLFWEQVDETAIGITRAFLPVIAWIRKTRIDEVPSIGEIHQQIHGIVAFTAWLAVCNRRSVSIIEFEWPTPGECDLPSSNTENFDEWVYRKGLKRVEQYCRKRGSYKPRRARVMIAIAPSAWRYTVASDGYWKVRLQQKRAVYYHGLQDDMDEKKEHSITLSKWATMQRAKAEGGVRSLAGQFWRYLGAMLVALFLAWAIVHRGDPVQAPW